MRWMIIMLLALQLWAVGEDVPSLFAQLGDPLFAYAQRADSLKDDSVVGCDAALYAMRADAVRMAGLAAESGQKSGAKTAYLKQLRSLQEEFDHLMSSLKRELLNSMKKSDTDRFMQIISTQPAVANQNRSLREKVVDFYKANSLQGQSAFLDNIAKQEADMDTIYTGERSTGDGSVYGGANIPSAHMRKQVIVLGTASCPYCIKARSFLREKGIPFRDLNVNTSKEGRRLYKKHHGHGVPLILVGDARIPGFNPYAILQAYGK
jgi:glutaredoxin